jgi:hypothetical protein
VRAVGETYPGLVLDLNSLGLEEIVNALADQNDHEHRWLTDPHTGEITFRTADTGIDGQTPVDLDELDLVVIEPLPSWVCYQDMADFAGATTGERARRRLGRVIQGKGAFRRSKDELHEEYPSTNSTAAGAKPCTSPSCLPRRAASTTTIPNEPAPPAHPGRPRPLHSG